MESTKGDRLEVVYIAPTELVPYADNPRIHPERQIKKLMASIEKYGIVLPILIGKDKGIIAGHAVVEAAIRLEKTEVPCVYASHLNEAQIREYILADNRLAEDSTWDTAKLKAEMLHLRDNYGLTLEGTGFESREILRLRLDVAEPLGNEDEVAEEPECVVSRPGDIWLLGDHRLACGSSTDAETVAALLAGLHPHIMVTDPPYGVNYDPAWRNKIKSNQNQSKRTGKVLNDDEADWREAWALFPGDVAYIWHASLYGEIVAESMRVCGFSIRSQIVWAKPHFALSRGDYHWQHECCFYALREDGGDCPEMPGYCPGYDSCWYAIREGKKSHWTGSRSQSTLWQIDFKDQDEQTTHGTQKPVECMRRPMLNNSEPGDIVYEPFSGAGRVSSRRSHAVGAALRWS